MQRYLFRAWIALVTFGVGLVSNNLVNSLSETFIEQYETACNISRATLLWKEPRLVPPRVHSCGHFIVTVMTDGRLYLNQQPMGTLDSPDELLDRLREAFRVRTENHVYRLGMEATSDVPAEERIEKVVYLRVARSISYGEVADLIEALKAEGANPIGLVTNP